MYCLFIASLPWKCGKQDDLYFVDLHMMHFFSSQKMGIRLWHMVTKPKNQYRFGRYVLVFCCYLSMLIVKTLRNFLGQSSDDQLA